MAIRTRLLVLLLLTALVPLAVTSVAHQISLRVAQRRLTENTREVLDTNARQALQEQLRSHVEVLLREKRLVQSLLERQAREVELALFESDRSNGHDRTDLTFGFDPDLTISTTQMHPLFRDANDPNVAALNIDYQRQSYRTLPWSDANDTIATLDALSPLTPVYHQIYTEAPEGTLWLTTMLRNISTHYPAGGRTPESRPPGPRPSGDFAPQRQQGQNTPLQRPRTGDFQPQGLRVPQPPTDRPRDPNNSPQRQRRPGGPPPRQGIVPGGELSIRRQPLIVDESTGQVTVLVSVPVRDPNDRVIGSTGLVRTVHEIFASLPLPERWGTGIERMVIQVDPNSTPQPSARILLHDNPEPTMRRWRRLVIPPRLESPDNDEFQAMIADIVAGKSGVRTMQHKDCSCLWAYRPVDVQNAATLFVVPCSTVNELAQTMEDSLIKESLAWLQITSIVFVVVAIGAVVLAFNRSRLLIHPISSLIDAGRRLARGDYDAQVHIDTGDELEQLGHVFNQAGPKLREHEKMKRSLELAGAVQQSLLPKQTPVMNNFDIAGQVLYCDETGGDCYDFIDLSHASPGKSGIALGDVSGHGIDAALLMAAVRGSLKAEAMHHGHNLVPLLKQLNQQIIQDTTDDKFVTLFYGILDDASRSLIWTSAGHEPALWFRSEAGHIEELQSTGMPIGIMHDALYEQAGPTDLSPGDVLLVVTDGAREAQNDSGELFGTDRLYQVLKDNAHRNSQEISAAVIQAVVEFQGPAPRTDDITLVVIKSL